MVYFQQSLFGKMSWERFHQITGWILEPSYPLSQTPMFQCLLLEDGQEPEWCEGERLTSAGGSWTPSIGQAPGWHDGSASFLWQTLEDGVPTKYFLSPAQCSHFLHLAEIAGCPPPAEIEALLLKQGGAYQLPDPFNASVCGPPPRSGRKQRSETASDCQLTLFPLCQRAAFRPLPFGTRTIPPGAASAFPQKRNVSGSWGCRRAGQNTALTGRKFYPLTAIGRWETPSRCPVPSTSWLGSRRR